MQLKKINGGAAEFIKDGSDVNRSVLCGELKPLSNDAALSSIIKQLNILIGLHQRDLDKSRFTKTLQDKLN